MKVLVVFATIEGQTRKIALFVEQEISKAGHEPVLFDATDKAGAISFEGIDKVILAASVHERKHPKPFEVFLTAHREELRSRPTLLLSVSLNAAFKEGLEEAEDYVTEMNMRTRFTPDSSVLVAGAVRTQSYDYFATQVVRHVVLQGHDYDPGQGDHEFTDWNALAKTVSDFCADDPKSN